MGWTGEQVLERPASERFPLERPPLEWRERASPATPRIQRRPPDPRGFTPTPLAWLADPALRGWRGLVKRAEDIGVALLILILIAPLMLLIALWISLDSPGPILFRQRRIGLAGREFQMFKFRTMRVGPEEPTLRQATRDDARVTRAGGFLRRASFDELPQLLNVLRGEMSLVGPRPHAPGTRAAGHPFEMVVPFYPARHRVRPGMTGLAQVRGWRGETDTEEKLVQRVRCDLEYIGGWSVWLDLLVLARTLGAMFSMRNAY